MIALDVMGGDFSPHASLEAALSASKKNIPIILCGPEKTISSLLEKLDNNWRSYPLEICDYPDVIEMHDHPVEAISKKKRSSLIGALEQVKKGKATTCVSAGNSGAFMVAATLMLGKQSAIDRPAIGGFLPGLHNKTFCLDLGANSDCKPHFLLQFAQLGLQYLQHLSPNRKLRIGLLSNGSESTKGNALTKEAFSLLKNSGLPFIGNIEPKDIFYHKADVIVCDGFTGNILLKTCEAIAEVFVHRLQTLDVTTTVSSTIVKNIIEHELKPHFDWQKQGGALLLGLQKPVVIAHGASNAYALESALVFAWNTIIPPVVEKSPLFNQEAL